jgi:K+-sensing histidine kinase KdpD
MSDGSAPPRSDSAIDPRWAALLSLTAHEIRSPLTVVAGYVRMLLKESAGPLSDQQRRLLDEAEKSCARLSALLAEVSELAQLEAGTARFNYLGVNLESVLSEAIAALPDLKDRQIAIDLTVRSGLSVKGDAVRLRTALTSILHALRREAVSSDQLAVRVDARNQDGQTALCISIAEPSRIEAVAQLEPSDFSTFDEWRGGNGLSLPNARRVIEALGGRLWAPNDNGKAAAIVMLPAVSDHGQ